MSVRNVKLLQVLRRTLCHIPCGWWQATGRLDTRASEEIAGLLRQIANDWGRAVVIVTHDPRIAAYADRIIFLKDGRIVDQTILEPKNGQNAEMVADRMLAFGS